MHTYVTDGNRWYDGTLGNVFSDDADEDAADYYDDVLASAQFPEILPVATKRVTKKNLWMEEHNNNNDALQIAQGNARY